MDVAGHGADAEHDAGVLHAVVRVVELGADGADFRPQGVLKQPLQPVGVDDLHVVVQEQQDFAAPCAAAKLFTAE